jgi:carboxyl-terminal processing protease
LFQKRDYCYYKIKNETQHTYKTTKDPVDTEFFDCSCYCRSSASEIVLALQDLDRCSGRKRFGKGLVQRLDLTFGTQLKVTISRYYTPSGRCIQALDYSRKRQK